MHKTNVKKTKKPHFMRLFCVNRDALSSTLLINCSSNGFGFSQINGDGVAILPTMAFTR